MSLLLTFCKDCIGAVSVIPLEKVKSEAMNKCLYCYLPLNDDEIDFHSACSKKFFGTENPPEIDFSLNDIDELAVKILRKKHFCYRSSTKTYLLNYRKKRKAKTG